MPRTCSPQDLLIFVSWMITGIYDLGSMPSANNYLNSIVLVLALARDRDRDRDRLGYLPNAKWALFLLISRRYEKRYNFVPSGVTSKDRPSPSLSYIL